MSKKTQPEKGLFDPEASPKETQTPWEKVCEAMKKHPPSLQGLSAEHARLKEELRVANGMRQVAETKNGLLQAEVTALLEENARLMKERDDGRLAAKISVTTALELQDKLDAERKTNARLLEWLGKVEAAANAQGLCPGCPRGKMASQGVPAYGQPGMSLWAGYVHHPDCKRQKEST